MDVGLETQLVLESVGEGDDKVQAGPVAGSAYAEGSCIYRD